MWAIRAVAVAVALFLASGVATAAPTPTPLWTSDQLRQAHGLAAEDALVLDVQVDDRVRGKPDRVLNLKVTLTPTFTFVEGDERPTLEDHSLCQTLRWKPGAATLTSMSCYVMPAFRVIELQNRQMLAKVVAASGSVNEAEYLHLSEAELGVQVRNAQRLDVVKTGGAVEYRMGRKRVARMEGAAGQLSSEEARRVRRFLARTVALHPQVRAEVAAAGVLPASIESTAGALKLDEGRRVVRFANPRRASVAYPLPAGLASDLASQIVAGASARDRAIQRAAAVIEGKAAPLPAVELQARLDKAAADGRGLDAFMLFLQISQDRPEALPSAQLTMERLRPAISASPEAAQFIEANRLAGDGKAKGDREAAARFLVSDIMKAAPFSTFRHVTYANLLVGSGDTKGWDPKIAAAMPRDLVDNYWIHVAAHPWSSHAYADAGKVYFGAYAMDQAWIAFDLGRAVDPRWKTGPLSAIEGFETQVRQGEPDFF